MSIEVYKLTHLVGLMLLFLGLGVLFFSPTRDGQKPPKAAAILHGIGLLIMLVGGFGMLARMEIHWPWPGYIIAKLVGWVLLGAAPVLVKKGILPKAVAFLLVLGIAAYAAWLGLLPTVDKPF